MLVEELESESESDNSEKQREKFEKKSASLIKKLKLKPKKTESYYSQSFIDRERDVIKQMRTYTKHRVTTAASLYHEKRERMR